MQARARWMRGSWPQAASHRARCLLLFVCGLLSTAPAHADDSAILQIRARTRLLLREVEHHGERGRFSVSVSAQLADQGGTPAASEDGSADATRSFDGMRLLLSIESERGLLQRETISTDRQGLASHTFSRLPAGAYHLRAQFAGDDLRDPVEATLDIELARQPSELFFSVANTHLLGAPLVVSGLSLRSQNRPMAQPVTLSVFESQNGQALGPPRAQQRLHLGGDAPASEARPATQGTHSLFLSSPVAAGTVLLVRAEYAGDADTAPSQAEREVLVITQARLTLEASASEVPQGGRLRLSGTLFTSSDRGTSPLAGELVDIEASQAVDPPEAPRRAEPSDIATAPAARPPLRRLLGTAISDEQGRFVLDLHRLPLRPAATELIAKVVPSRRYIRPGVSNELQLTVLPPEPVSLLPFLLPLALSAALALLVRLLRFLRPRLAEWLQARRARRRAEQALSPTLEAASSSPGQRDPQAGVGSAGVSLSSRSSLSLRRTVDTTLDGTVFDAAFGGCVARAQVVVTPLAADPATQQRASECDAEGRFVISQLRAGRCVVRITAAGYQPQEFAANIPHRGELRAIAVRLLPLRVKLLADWQRVAQVFYGDASLVQTRTPQDLLRDAVAPPTAAGSTQRPLRTPVPSHVLASLRRLTELVEEGYYSGRVCSDAMLHESQRLAALIAPSNAPAAPSPPRADAAPRPMQ